MHARDVGPGACGDAALTAIIGGRRAWSPAAGLERRFGVKVFVALLTAGWVVAWSVDAQGRKLRARSWTLSGWAAERLGVSIHERAPDCDGIGVPYWARAGDDQEADARSHSIALGSPNRIPDPKARDATRYLLDEDGEPVTLFGGRVPVGRRAFGGKR